jgi:hypothetical protein
MRFAAFAFSLALAGCSVAWAQAERQEVNHHGMMHAMDMRHHVSKTAKLFVADDSVARVMTLRVGPVTVPAHADHMAVAQPRDFFLKLSFDGWLVAYHPRMVDAQNRPLPNKLLHHVAFWNTSRSDFLCANKEEHIFGAGGEMNDWPAIPGFGYPVEKGNRIRISTMFANPTAVSYPAAYLEVRVEYRVAKPGATPALQDIYPVWFDVMGCGNSGYDLPPGQSSRSHRFLLRYSGKLLGVGGHLHDYGDWLVLKNATTSVTIATLSAKLDKVGHIVSMPIDSFASQGGYPLRRGDEIEVIDAYDNPKGKALPEGAMGIVVGYFLPDNLKAFTSLRRSPNVH